MSTTFDPLSYQHSEQQVIGTLLLDKELREKYIDVLGCEDFTDKPMAEIFAQIVAIYKAGGAVDPVLVINACKSHLDDAQKIIIEAAESVVSVSTFPEHVNYLKEAARKRRIANRLEELRLNGSYDIAALQAIIDSETAMARYNAADVNAANIDAFVEALNQPKDVLYTGFPLLDEKLGGIRRSTLTVIGARPSTGKTTFALNIARNQIANKRRVLFFSLEMTAAMIFEKYAADVCRIDSRRFTDNRLSARNVGSVKGLMKAIRDGNKLFVVDNVYTIEGITRMIYAEKPDMVFIDYAQRIRSVQKHKTERELINLITSELKIAAKRTKTCIVLLSQIARAGKDAPTMSNLKESGALEEDGDYILILHRPFVLDKTDVSVQPGDTELLIDKNKFGSCGAIDLKFILPFQRFEEDDSPE